MAVLLSLAAFASGAAALLFEALWLRRAGIMLGSTVWASSIVLASFMAGLATGNALAGRFAARWPRPLLIYAALELAVAMSAIVATLVMPGLAALLAPLFRAVGGAPALTNLLRLAVAFALMLPATTAMGMTLPFLTRALSRGAADFGRVLGYLYGANTLGGALGAVAGELWLVARFGLRGTALFAAGANLLAAGLAVGVARGRAADAEAGEGIARPPLSARSGAPIGLTDRGKSRSCERAEARRGKILDVSDRGATKARDANPRFPDGSQTVRCSSPIGLECWRATGASGAPPPPSCSRPAWRRFGARSYARC